MDNDYDQITAHHYSAFRPSLHQPILNKCIERNEKHYLGLDVGCGTGHSSISLANHCDKVIGIEPSKNMLENSIFHPQVEYLNYNCKEDLEFKNNSFDIITFAGSLYYGKSQKLLNEVTRVGKYYAKIIVYDFEIPLNGILTKLNIGLNNKKGISYNHQEDFSGLIEENLETGKSAQEEISIQINSSNLTHLLLSSKNNYRLLIAKFGNEKLYDKIKNKLHEISKGEKHNVMANIYYTNYKCISN